jgi:MoxR-like ATPase
VLHLLHPNAFECISSDAHKKQIASAFADLAPADAEDLDAMLAGIRLTLTPTHGEGFTFYDPSLVYRWNPSPDTDPWGEVAYFAKLLRGWDDFDENERKYKQRAGQALGEAREALLANSPDAVDRIIRGINHRENNLIGQFTKPKLIKWLRENEASAREAIRSLWAHPENRDIDGFVAAGGNALGATGAQAQVAAWFLFAADQEPNAPYAPSVINQLGRLLKQEVPSASDPASARYSHALGLFDQCRDECAMRGVELRDRLDAQSVLWCIEKYSLATKPINGWSSADRRRFDGFKKQGDPKVEPVPPTQSERIKARYEQVKDLWQDSDHAAGFEPGGSEELRNGVAAALEDGLRESSANLFIERLRSLPDLPNHLLTGAHAIFQTKVANAAVPDRTTDLLHAWHPPANEAEAEDAIALLAGLAEEAGATPGMAALVATCIWALQDSTQWPPLWRSAEEPAQRLGWLPAHDRTSPERYFAYRALLLDLDAEAPQRAARVLSWWPKHFCGLDPSLQVRCAENEQLATRFFASNRTMTAEEEATASANAMALTGDLVLAGEALADQISQISQRKVRRDPANLRYGPKLPYRTNAFVVWRGKDSPSGLGPRLWVTSDRVVIGLSPGRHHAGWSDEAAAALSGDLTAGLQWFKSPIVEGTYTLEPTGDSWAGGTWIVGQEVPFADSQDPGFAEQILEVTEQLLPAVEALEGLLGNGGLPPPTPTADDEIDHIAAAADDLLIDRAYLGELEWYLRDKGQIVLYGPPGTGKTFVAKRFARALAQDDPDRVEIVQFHPSTSYEDFFEGIRPRTEDGKVVYDVVEGPLARIARKATTDRQHDHVLVIDEINRANLPKVLGELLFLLEYRDEAVATLYREEFKLPSNLLIIGTMNTADRSIALIDAAMRRRFHFRPFFPNEEPVAGVLRRWLSEQSLPLDVADLLDAINEELTQDLGRDLQLGPSHFMRADLDDDILGLVWRANVEPFIEDHLFDQPSLIARYRWEQVRSRHHQRPSQDPIGDGGPEGDADLGESGEDEPA